MTDNNYQAILDLIKNISGQKNIISLPRIFLKVAGDVVVGLFLSQCVWYSDKGGSHDGWFFKSNKDWQNEIGLSYAQVKRATAKLEEMGVLQTKLKKAKGAPTTHYYVDMDALTKLILDFLEIRQSEGVENQESLKSQDFEESQKTITTLTPASTDTTLEGKTPARDYLTDVLEHSKKPDRAGVADPSQDIAAYMEYANEFTKAYHDITSLHAAKSQKPKIEKLAEKGNGLEFWRDVVDAWVGAGWNPKNIDGMIDCYQRGEIPSTGGNKSKGKQSRKQQKVDGPDKHTNLMVQQGMARISAAMENDR
jgi:hypothetical protein